MDSPEPEPERKLSFIDTTKSWADTVPFVNMVEPEPEPELDSESTKGILYLEHSPTGICVWKKKY